MSAKREQAEGDVWIGHVSVTPLEGCEILPADQGAFVHVLTIAIDENDYRTKVVRALACYRLNVTGMKDVSLFDGHLTASEDIHANICELMEKRNPADVRFVGFRTYPRVM